MNLRNNFDSISLEGLQVIIKKTSLISEPHTIATVQATAKQCKIQDMRILVLNAYDRLLYEKYAYQSWETSLHHDEHYWLKSKDQAKEVRITKCHTGSHEWNYRVAKGSHDLVSLTE